MEFFEFSFTNHKIGGKKKEKKKKTLIIFVSDITRYKY
jgi:hypothetical protein